MSCVFLMLFPSGAADFLAPRPVVTIEYLMMCEGGIVALIFATLHSRYAQELCKLDASTMYVRQHPFSKEQLVVKEKHFANASAILRNKAVLVQAAKSPWLVCPVFFAQLTFNVCPPHLSRQS